MLAARAGVSRSAVSKIELEQRVPGTVTLGKLAAALGVTVGELLYESAPPPQSQAFGAFARVPVVRPAHAGAVSVLQETGEYEWVPSDLEMGRSLLAAPIIGDCLAPAIEPGDVVLWDTRRRQPEHGEIAVVTTAEGELRVKRVVRLPDGQTWLTDRHGAMEQPDGIKLEGVVVRIIRIPHRGM